MNAAPILRAVGDAALLVEFGTTIDEATFARVLALDASLVAQPPAGILETVPSYTSLLIVFDPVCIDLPALKTHVIALAERVRHDDHKPVEHVVPVCYDGDLAPDIEAVAKRLGITPDAVATLHTGGHYRVYMYGFAPGYAYLGGVPEALRLPRKASVVRSRPVGSVMIAAGQCLVTTLQMPTGWWVIGQTAFRVLDPESPKPFRFQPGDYVRFERISAARLAHQARP